MSTLEEALRLACQKGMTHFSLHPVPSEDRKKMYWCARATPSTGHHYIKVDHVDPVEAMKAVLHNLPAAKKRKIEKSPLLGDPYEQLAVTATATEPPSPPEPETIETWLPKT